MRVIRFSDSTNTLKVEPESFDDLYTLAIVMAKGDIVESKSYRKFKPEEGATGEMKEVYLKLAVEKAEIDKSASRLRLIGRIIDGKPLEFIRINSYHTINVAPGDTITIQKQEWEDYLLRKVKQAVSDSKKPRIGIIALDDEKASVAYVRGYGIDIIAELYSHLSKRMKEKDFEKEKKRYFDDIIKAISNMQVDKVIVAGPGFMKDDIKQYISFNRININKAMAYASASDAERSGIREVMQSDVASGLLESGHVKKEFDYLNLFLKGLRTGSSFSGSVKIASAMKEYRIGVILVNDSVLNDDSIKGVLRTADKQNVKIEIFNAEDDAGMQLKNFGNIAGIEKGML